MEKCSVTECHAKPQCKGLCLKHYTRYLRYGDTSVVKKPRGEAAKLFDSLIAHEGDDCIYWPFTTTSRQKRPWVQVNGKGGTVARHMCIQIHGDRGSEIHAAHRCGDFKCVNPNHIRWASAKENSADKIRHGTVSNGSKHGNSKLTEADVLEIRRLYGVSRTRDIAEKYGIGTNHVYRIVDRSQWGHV